MKTRQEIMLENGAERTAIQITELKEEIEHLKAKLQQIKPLAIGLMQTDYKHIRQVGEKILKIIRGNNDVDN